MRLECNDFLPDVECPWCHKGIDVDNTHEERLSDIDDEGKCPHCELLVRVVAYTKFDIVKGVK